jgi:serine/threonine protein kinase/TPR repeat protein
VTFDHYEVMTRDDGSLHELGRGAMGITYKAFDTNLRIPVALKVINATFLHSDVARQRFVREARSAAKLRHRHVASVFHLGIEADAYFYAMEFIDGETVDALIKRHGPLKPIAALRIAGQVARALNAAQPHGLVHRDIKPANLMLVREDDELIVKVIDFGLAKSSHATDGEEESSACSMGGFVGTPHFASPEQLEEKEIDVRSDIYSLGVTLWYMLAGQAPFAGSMAQVMSQHLSKPPPFEKLSDLSPSVSDLLTRMLQKDPKDRPQNPAELRREIEACIDLLSAHASSATAPEAEENAENFETVFEEISAPRPEETAFVVDAVVAGRFRILQDLGETNTGHLYRAHQLQPDREVRLLVLGRELTDDTSTSTQIEHEVARAASVTHPSLLQTYSLERFEGCSFIVSEWTDGFSLQELLRVRRELAASEVLALLPQTADGIDHATRAGLRHLDLALHQVFVAFATPAVAKDEVMRRPVESWPTFTLKLNPLGITRELSASETWAGGQTIVTDVAAPQPERENPANASIRALAAIVYELLGGTLTPFALNAAATHRYSPIATLSEEGNNVLRRALEPSAPFTTAYEFYSALSGVKGLEVERREARPSSAAPRTAAATTSRITTSPVRTAPPVLRTAPVPQRVSPEAKPPAPSSPPPRRKIPEKFFGGLLTIIAIGVAIFFFAQSGPKKEISEHTEPAKATPPPEFVETIPQTPPISSTPTTVGPTKSPTGTTPPVVTIPPVVPPPPPPPDTQAMIKAAIARADALTANKDWAAALRAWLAIEKESPDAGKVGLEMLLLQMRKELPNVKLEEVRDLALDAAHLDIVSAMTFLGEALHVIDPTAAFNWYSAAAQRGDRHAITQLGQALARRGELTNAFACFEDASAQGGLFATYLLGECYIEGKGVKPDPKRGVALLEKAVDMRDPTYSGQVDPNGLAMDRLGVCYRTGVGVERDLARAFELFSSARALGNKTAIGNLGVLYMNGEGVPKDPTKAATLFREGGEAGAPVCMSLYARCLESGTGVRVNLLKAETWYRKAAQAGDKYALDWCRAHKINVTPAAGADVQASTTRAQP